MEKVTIDYNRLCLELEKQGKTKADLSRDMTKNKNFVGLMEKNPDQLFSSAFRLSYLL